MNEYAIVIPSKTKSNLAASIGAIRKAGVKAPVIVVWDGDDAIDPDEEPFHMPGFNIYVIPGVKPFCFSRNVNRGIHFAAPRDVLLLNDDAKLETALGFDTLAIACQNDLEVGIGAPMVRGLTCASEQRVPSDWIPEAAAGHLWRVHNHMIPFIAVYMRREVVKRLMLDYEVTPPGCVRPNGPLHEAFYGWVNDAGEPSCPDCRGTLVRGPDVAGRPDPCQCCGGGERIPRAPHFVYGGEDDELCYRVRRAGLKIGIHDSVIVDHQELPSTFREPGRGLPVAGARAVFRKIHGFDMGEK